MDGLDCLFYVKRFGGRQEGRFIVPWFKGTDDYGHLLADVVSRLFDYLDVAVKAGWELEAIHLRILNPYEYRDLVDARDKGITRDWYEVPIRIMEEDKVKYLEDFING